MDVASACLNDTDLLRRCRRGEAGAWESVRQRYSRLVASVCHRAGVAPAYVPEILQDTIVALFLNLSKIRSDGAVGGWIAVTATRLARRHKAMSTGGLPLSEDIVVTQGRDFAEELVDQFINEELELAVRGALEAIPPKAAELVAMVDLEGLPYLEVAAKTSTPVGSIGPTRMRALKKLRTALESWQCA